ncbi:MAG: ABC transporter ATP-binding protein [Streptosporangiaceae bacterium]
MTKDLRNATLPQAATRESAGGAERLAVATEGLRKRFRGGQVAVDDLGLAVPAGSVFGFLGPNGSGKTTTIRMLLGLMTPTAGTAHLLGAPMPAAGRSVLPRVGALIEGPALYPHLSGRDNLTRFDAADPTSDPRTRSERVGHALERVGLSAASRKRCRAYSLGMRQRLALASALLRPRELLVLDEPTNGLDPQGTREIRTLVRDLARDGATVFLSSHLLAEVEQVCEHAAVLSRGRLVAQGAVADIRRSLRTRLVVLTPDTERATKVLNDLGVTDLAVEDGRVSCDPSAVAPDDACRALVLAEVRVVGLTTENASLEDAYVALTGEGFDVAE